MAGDTQTILVVEDEEAIASFVAAYLRKDGFAVRMTASGREALAIVGLDAALARRPRPDAARPRRDRGVPAHPRDAATCPC